MLAVRTLLLAAALLPWGGAGASGVAPAIAPVIAPLPLSVTMVSDTALTLDSNSPTVGPGAQYVAFRITNTSAATVGNLTAAISGFASGVTLAGGQAAVQYVGSLAGGASKTVYWFVSYPPTYLLRVPLTVTVTDGAGNVATGSAAVRTVSMISAQAGGLASTSTIGPGAVVGQFIPLDVAFTFKGWKAGDTFNLQPAGNAGFPAGCFQLASSVITSVDADLALVIPNGTTDRQHYRAATSSPGGGSQWSVNIRYWFRYLCTGASGTPLPYSNELSGTQLKYSSDYGIGGGNPGAIPPAPAPAATFTIGKSASATVLSSGGTVTYTVTVQNTSTFNVTIDSIQDVLPASATYTGLTATSQVTAANSASIPASGSTGTVVWRANPGVSWAIAAGGTLSLVYTVTIPNAPGTYANSARPYVGSTLLGTASVTVAVGSADVSVTKTGPTTLVAGDTIRYLLAVANAGPSAATGVVLKDNLPVGLTFVRGSRGATLASGVVTWPALASLASGASVTDTLFALAPATLGTITNVALATTTSSDPVATNNDGSGSAMQVVSQVATPVRVTPDGLASPLRRLPASRSSQLFTVENLGPAAATYALVAAGIGTPSSFLTIDSITGASLVRTARADSVRITLAARASGGYTVWYRVAAGDTALEVERLLARHVAQAAWMDTGWVDIRRAFPTLAISKGVTPTSGIRPGIDLTYNVQFSNAGEFDASQVEVIDEVPAQVMFKLASLGQSLPAGLGTAVQYSRDGGATWTYVPVTSGCGAPAGYDACINRIRWTVTGGLLQPAMPATVTFVARVR
jgi:uncharacterized repeat protein (TIGR01451 family)